jgi:hypothetical protein
MARASLNIVTASVPAARAHAPNPNLSAKAALPKFHLILPRAGAPQHSGTFIDPDDSMGCGSSCVAETTRYYQAIGVLDASGSPTRELGSLTAWKKTFGFSPNPLQPVGDEVRAVYFNNGDLQFGRDMHCREIRNSSGVTQKVACYVSNFSNTGQASGDPQLSIGLAQRETGPIATVAMLFTAATQQVDFYVYVNDALSGLAALDSEGNKAVPGVCIACHGGNYLRYAHRTSGSSFLPFDTSLFVQSNSSAAFSEPAQREAFRKLNGMVKDTAPAQTIQALIDGWYGWCHGVGTSGCHVDDRSHPFVPAGPCPSSPGSQTCGWDDTSVPGVDIGAFYRDVPKVYCRTCHIARPSTFNVQSFAEFRAQAQLVHDDVCAPGTMPDAEVPYNGLWSNRPLIDRLSKLLHAIDPTLPPCHQ